MNKITVEEVKQLVKEEYHGNTLMMFFKEDACPLHEAAPAIAVLCIEQADEIERLQGVVSHLDKSNDQFIEHARNLQGIITNIIKIALGK